jgi:glutamate synthase (NADPH/NADH) small chain
MQRARRHREGAPGGPGPDRDGLRRPGARAATAFGCKLDHRGNIVHDDDMMTTAPGVFAAGDCSRGQSLVVWAIHEGRLAARGVDKFLMFGETVLPG